MVRLCLFFFLFLFCYSFGYCQVTPEQFGAHGDGISDDTEAFIKALNEDKNVLLTQKYRIKALEIPSNKKIFGTNSSAIIYYDIIVNSNVKIEGVLFDGEWSTKGVHIIGSNVSIINCKFINTKGVLEAYGGLTATIWIGQFSDLSLKMTKYHNITIDHCIFDGCTPFANKRNGNENSTVARFILSYCCDYLNISNCSFFNLFGTIDSDAIHISGYEINTRDTPFYSRSDKWIGNSPPYKGYVYSSCNVTIENCYFVQKDCKSSIKIMSSGVIIKNNTFDIRNSGTAGSSYSVVRVHYAKDISIIKNSFNYVEGDIESIIKIGIGSRVKVVYNNVWSKNSNQNGIIKTILNCAYSADVLIKKNKCILTSLESLLYTEFNHSLRIINNELSIWGDLHNLYGDIGNHYTYPVSKPEGKILFKGNTINCEYPLLKYNKSEYPVSCKNNHISLF